LTPGGGFGYFGVKSLSFTFGQQSYKPGSVNRKAIGGGLVAILAQMKLAHSCGFWGQIFNLYIWSTELQAGQRKPESNWGGLVAILARMKLAHS
jgi:hypothetical protein